jgi:hypothetical protein
MMMTPEENFPDFPGEAVRHIVRMSFERTNEPGLSRLSGLKPVNGEVRIMILFDGPDYPFEQHYRYARHRDAGTPYTFSNMEFAGDAPGLRVGPWPGWRGIPGFPRATVRSGEKSASVTMMPWGDELTHRAIRGVASLDLSSGGTLLCEVGDARLRPVCADLYAGRIQHAVPVPVALLPEIEKSHPRLLFTRKDIPPLREKALGSHRDFWERIVNLLEGSHLPWEITPESKVPPGPERLSSEDRSVMAAFAAVIDPAPSRRSLARESFLGYVRETQQEGYQPLGIDTQAGETLFVLSLCYDWTHGEWTESERDGIRSWIRDVAGICWSHLGYERRDYGQAHYLGCALGLLAFSFLFWDEHPRAREWAGHCRGVLDTVVSMIPRDGFYPHGINLWIYEYGFLLRWLELFRVCTGTDLWHPTDRWQNSSAFRRASTSPDGLFGATFGDPQYRVGGDSWCHYLIAARTGSGVAQYLGDALRENAPSGVDFRSIPPRRRVYEFLFHDDLIEAERPDDCVRVFQDGGQVFARGSGKNSSLFTFRSGAPLGRQRYSAGEPGGYGHADPANGSFLVFFGDGPVICGPGPTYRKDTSLHNTITIDGRGQIGDSTVWLPDFIPPEVICPDAEFKALNGRVSIRAEMAPAYLPHLKVEKCLRALWVDPGRCIVGTDRVRCAERRSIEWNLHASEIRQTGNSGGVMVAELGGPRDTCRLILFDPADAEMETGLTEMVPAYPNDGTRIARLRVSVRGREASFLWCMLFDPSLDSPSVTAESERLSLRFTGGPTLFYRDGFLTAGEDEYRSR